MRKTNIEGFSRLPFTNPKFNKFFEAQKGISADLKAIFDVNTINNERFNELPHNIYFGEDITEVFSNDGLVDFICQLDNNGVSKAILGSFSNRTLESSVHYNFTFSTPTKTTEDNECHRCLLVVQSSLAKRQELLVKTAI